MLDFILRLAGAERLGQVIPKLEKPRVEHDENATDIPRTFLVQEQRAVGCVEIPGRLPFPLATEKLHRHEGIEEICDGARVHVQLSAEFRARKAAVSEFGEHTEF